MDYNAIVEIEKPQDPVRPLRKRKLHISVKKRGKAYLFIYDILYFFNTKTYLKKMHNVHQI